MSHIIRNRLRDVETYFLKSAGAFNFELFSPLYLWIPCYISLRMNSIKPFIYGYMRRLLLMMVTLA
jgi:hypothetical protein